MKKWTGGSALPDPLFASPMPPMEPISADPTLPDVKAARTDSSTLSMPDAQASQAKRCDSSSHDSTHVSPEDAKPCDANVLSDEITRRALEASGIGVWHYDPRSDRLTGNDVFWRMSGLELEGSHGVCSFQKWLRCLQSTDRVLVEEAWRVSFKRGESLSVDCRMSGASRAECWIRMVGNATHDESATPAQLVGTIIDITAEKLAEQEAMHRHHELMSLFELSAVGMAQAEPRTGRFLKVNQRFAEITGYTTEELLNLTFVDVTHSDDRARDKTLIGPVQRGEIDRWETEKRYVRPDGQVVWVHVTGRMMTDVHGQPYRTLASIVDISPRKETERILRDSEERYRAVVESQSGMVCRFRHDGTILFVNHPYALLRNTTPDQLIGANFWDFIPQSDWDAVRQMLAQLTPDSPEVHIENRFETADGPRWTMWTNRALEFDENGQWTVGQSTGLDITDRKRAEAALREADRRKDEFLATLAHELRNPLAPIRNAVQILNLRGPREPVLQEARDMIDRQLNHMVRLIDDLLDLSRITRGKMELRCEVLDLASVVEQAIESSQPLIKAGNHSLIASLPRHPVYLNADPVRLAQVFSNLLNNAAKYMDRNGRIWLTAIVQGKEVVIAVKDTGIGIDADHLPRLFQMFSQVQSAQQRSQGGLGIGLSLVRGLVEMHGGVVEARSDGLGCGSEFVVRLPLLDLLPDDPHDADSESTAGVRSAVRRILVADDNQDSATSLALLLRLTGNEVVTAHDGQEAFESARRSRPDVVLLDIGMPKLDGCATCRMIREQPWGKQMIVIAQTGWGTDADRQRTRDAGFDGHLVKPVALPTLLEMLNQLLTTNR